MKIALLTIFFLSTLNLYGFVIVSDFDDTIKQSHIGDKSQMVDHTFFEKWESFAGTSELFNGWINNEKGDCKNIHIISASPFFLKTKIRNFVKRLNLSSKVTLVMNKKIGSSTVDYKLRELENILKKNPAERFILIGDDTEYDPEIYLEFKKRHPNNVEATYIRWVKGREALHENQNYFFTAHDIAVLEEHSGRMKNITEIEDAILNADKELSFPDYLKHAKQTSDRPFSLIKSKKIQLWYETLFEIRPTIPAPTNDLLMSQQRKPSSNCHLSSLKFINVLI